MKVLVKLYTVDDVIVAVVVEFGTQRQDNV